MICGMKNVIGQRLETVVSCSDGRWKDFLLTAVPDNMCGDSLHYRGHHGCWNGQGRNLDVQGSDFILRDVYSFYCVMSDLRG